MRLGLAVALLLGCIVAANVLTANEPPLTFDWLGQTWVVTWGTFFIAATFVLRDAIQLEAGRRAAYAVIGGALALNVALSLHYDDLLWVTVGSAVAFAISESLDTEVFSRLRASVPKRVAVSGVVGGTVDSVAFALIALSPLTTGIVPWEFLWTTVVAQVVIKCAASVVASVGFVRAESGPPPPIGPVQPWWAEGSYYSPNE
jgi:uncharacterized PurR-regulated membrane protein YhhQ (DUF165 family)